MIYCMLCMYATQKVTYLLIGYGLRITPHVIKKYSGICIAQTLAAPTLCKTPLTGASYPAKMLAGYAP